jgi:uncharacterized membrane protein YdcZ (DUF606 family)
VRVTLRPRPIYLKVVDVLALVLIGAFAAGWCLAVLDGDNTLAHVLGSVFAAVGLCWFVSAVVAVRYLWTGRDLRLTDLLRRRARPASP